MNKDDKILIISPHADDEALDSGGLIMRAKKEGVYVYVFYVSTGGSRQFSNGETKEEDRIAEARNASVYGGFNYTIGFRNTSTKVDMIPQKEIIEAIEDIVKDIEPTIVVMPNRDSYAQDHRAVATACISAFRPIPQVLHHQPKMILEVEESNSWPTGFSPNFYVDITDYLQEKLNLYSQHKSQLVKNPHVRSNSNLIALSRFRGSEIGVEHAEAYKLLKMKL